jgi:hypothetical protein
MDPRALHMPGKHSTIELHPQPNLISIMLYYSFLLIHFEEFCHFNCYIISHGVNMKF